MNPIDVLTLLLIVVALILGWRSGAIPQISGLIGAIGGVVFAEARTDPQVGYAQAATEVWDRIRTSKIGRAHV